MLKITLTCSSLSKGFTLSNVSNYGILVGDPFFKIAYFEAISELCFFTS